jgi:iodotyrosine deiodinase
VEQALSEGEAFYAFLDSRRSVRSFSADPVPRELIDLAIRSAGTAPSGAHRQPWQFVIVGDPAMKHQIREAAEAEERINYDGGRINSEWRAALAPLKTDANKSFLDVVPWIVVLFEQRMSSNEGADQHNYYVKESCGIAAGLFIAALHRMGLATLTHTPSPMAFLTKLLKRPSNERPFVLFPIGYPADDCEVPDLVRKPLDEISTEVRQQ